MTRKAKLIYWAIIFIGAVLFSSCRDATRPMEYFSVKVIDAQTGRGVPLVELKTVNDIRYYTDSNGVIAFYEPGLMNRDVFFHIQSHGYEVPADGFGYRGATLRTQPGANTTIQLTRNNIAERLYRVTGQGIYRDTMLIGGQSPLSKPVLNGRVLGQDSVMAVVYKGKIYWFWGDTNRESYPLGHFGTAGATSQLPQYGGLDPGVGVDLTYFVDNEGFSKPMVSLRTDAMIWIDALMTLEDEQGNTRLLAHYKCMAGLDKRVEHGLIVFDDEEEIFIKLIEFPLEAKLEPGGHPFRVSVNNEDYLYFGLSPYPLLRVKADWKHVTELSSYEAFTCLKEGSRYDRQAPDFDRAEDGALRWGWKQNTAVIDVREHRDLIADGTMKPEQAWLDLHDIETKQPVYAQGGSVHWNAFRRRWIMIVGQVEGASNLGEIWYAEADAPEGPWRWACKIVTHEKYSFYNPTQHVFFDQRNGQNIYFEGTYTQAFSAADVATPWYNYNQIMYRLDLSDSRLHPP